MDDEKQIINGPMYYIQNDWEDSLNKVAGEIWIIGKDKCKGSRHGRVVRTNSFSDGNTSAVTATEGFNVNLLTHNAIQIGLSDSKYSNIFVAARSVYSNVHKKSVTSLDVSEGSVCVSVSSENETSVAVWLTDTEDRLITFSEHVGGVYKCRWFPSGKVVLSCGADMSLKIWCCETGRCPVTLTGHTKGINDVEFVERGRNIISVSKDGHCKLWNCGEARFLDNLLSVHSSLNCCSLSEAPTTLALPEVSTSLSDSEIGTENKILLVGSEEGDVYCIAVRSRDLLFAVKVDSAVNCSSCIKPGVFVIGCQNGDVHLVSVEKRKVIASWCETNNPVLCSMAYKEKGFFVGHADGLCIYRSVVNLNSTFKLTLTGSDGDPIYDICCDKKFIYTACRDSNVRKYAPDSYINRHFETEL